MKIQDVLKEKKITLKEENNLEKFVLEIMFTNVFFVIGMKEHLM
jgi:hypothetical protein